MIIEEINNILKKYKKIQGFTNDKERVFLSNFIKKNLHIKNILEIGFNAGHSASTFLEARDDIILDTVDLCSNPYVNECYELIKKKFNRITLYKGSSIDILPKLNKKYDLIFIDGGHLYNIVNNDLKNSLKLSHKNTIIILDDCIPWEKWSGGIYKTLNEHINNKKLKDTIYYYSNSNGVFTKDNLNEKGKWENKDSKLNKGFYFDSIWAVTKVNL